MIVQIPTATIAIRRLRCTPGLSGAVVAIRRTAAVQTRTDNGDGNERKKRGDVARPVDRCAVRDEFRDSQGCRKYRDSGGYDDQGARVRRARRPPCRAKSQADKGSWR